MTVKSYAERWLVLQVTGLLYQLGVVTNRYPRYGTLEQFTIRWGK